MKAWDINEVVVFGGDKAGHMTMTGGEAPWLIVSDDTRDEPSTYYWLNEDEFTPMGIIV